MVSMGTKSTVCFPTNLVVNLGLKLDSGLDDIDGGKGTVGDGTTKGTSKGEPGMGVSDCHQLFTNPGGFLT